MNFVVSELIMMVLFMTWINGGRIVGQATFLHETESQRAFVKKRGTFEGENLPFSVKLSLESFIVSIKID